MNCKIPPHVSCSAKTSRDQDSGVRDEGLGVRDEGLGVRDEGLGVRV